MSVIQKRIRPGDEAIISVELDNTTSVLKRLSVAAYVINPNGEKELILSDNPIIIPGKNIEEKSYCFSYKLILPILKIASNLENSII